jgi:hypothetical protein
MPICDFGLSRAVYRDNDVFQCGRSTKFTLLIDRKVVPPYIYNIHALTALTARCLAVNIQVAPVMVSNEYYKCSATISGQLS